MSVKGKIFEDSSSYSISVYIAGEFSILEGFFLRRIFGRATYGLFSTFQVILFYAKGVHFGLLNALERESVYFLSK